ncbi:DUF4442 domain-containing protein [Marinobacteraceae bacterium S3BR75-40.1]
MLSTPQSLKRLLNIYPPYLGAGIKIEYVADDWKELHVGMALRWYNRNAVNTHFGGSLYSMIDPHLMLMLMQLLGRDYVIWDKAAEIEFVNASRRRVKSVISITDNDIRSIQSHTDDGAKYFPVFVVDIRDEADNVVARVKKTLYVKKKKRH